MARLERIIERLDMKEFQLRSLLDVTKAINNNMDRDGLLALFEQIVRYQLGITRLMLYERTDQWENVLAYGHESTPGEVEVEQLFSSFSDIQMIGSEAAGSLGAFDVAVPVYHRERPLAFLLIGDIDEEEKRMSPTVKHLNFIQTLTNLIVVAMENRRLARKELQQERGRRELELAAEMQAMLVPAILPEDAQVTAAGWYQPHSQVGGDYYDLVRLNDDELVVCVADVSGKGMAAALLMSNFQAQLRATVSHNPIREAGDMERMVRELNAKVQTSARGERYITLFVGHISLIEKRMLYVNAGHNPAMLYQDGKITTHHLGCIALGMMPELPFLNVGHVALTPGCTLLCFTDGLEEQEDATGTCFGSARLESALNEHAAMGPTAVINAIHAAYEAHRGKEQPLDDIAILACRLG